MKGDVQTIQKPFIDREGDYVKVVVPNARIKYKNFCGAGSQYNREGSRNFNIVIDDHKFAEALTKEGFNVRILPSKDENREPEHILKVNVSYRFRAPIIITHTNGRVKELDEKTVSRLDDLFIEYADLVMTRSHYDIGGNEGYAAYLQSGHFIIHADYFEDKYASEMDDDDEAME